MKRSRIIKNMTEYWLGLLPDENPANMGVDDLLFDEVTLKMGQLLSFLEHSGMMPPDTGKGQVLGTQYMSTHLDYQQEKDYRWESEND